MRGRGERESCVYCGWSADPAAAPVPYQVDGDLAGETPLEISVARNRYRLVVP